MYLSVNRDSRGSMLEICVPGTLVAIGLYGPRIPSGAPGFMSNVSIWAWPPLRNMKMQFLAGFRTREAIARCTDSRFSMPESDRPPIPSRPA